ncbi:MAG: serine hydrolase [bacterium]|nr:serine hydrolase [bacterium]
MARVLSLFLSMVFLTAPAILNAQEPAPVNTEPESAPSSIEELLARIQEILDEEKIPGVSIALVSREGIIWAGGLGKADVVNDIEVTGETLFRVGSISKSFTALAVMTLVERGQIDLDALVRDLAPEIEFSNPWAETHPVTVATVMEHTTGFDGIHFRDYAAVDDPDITVRQGLAFNPGSRVSRWKPGTHMSYCNAGPPIAAFILEKASGRTFEDYVREHVFDVLGMENSTFHYPGNASLMAKGYQDDGETEAHYDHITIRPSGALNTSSKEMARYLRMMINRGTLDGVQLLTPGSITRMETPTTTLATRAGFDYGYGLGNYGSIVKGHLFQGHDGGITGFASISAYSSDLGLGYFISANKPSGKTREIAELVGGFLTSKTTPQQGPTATLPLDELKAITGFYQDVTPRMQITHVVTRFLKLQRVTQADGKLFVKRVFGGKKKELIPVTPKSFRFEDQPVATMFNVEDEEGNQIAQWGVRGNYKKTPGFWIFLQVAAAISSFLLMLSAVLFALVWAPAKAFGKLKSIPLQAVLIPLLASLSPFASLVLPMVVSSDLISDLGNLSPVSLTIYLGTLVFTALTIFSFYTSLRAYSPKLGRFVRAHAILVTLACTIALIYLWSYDIIGLKTWAY